MKISYGNSRMEKTWKNNDISWDAFCQRVSQTKLTTETVEEYRKMTKAQQDQIKDVGGYVAGHLKDGRRKNGTVLSRSMLTLDMDHGTPDIADELEMLFGYKCCIYSTHKHTPEEPRLRLIIPLLRDISEEEYPAVARKVAQEIGMDMFDDTTYQPHRLMYWPSTSANGEFVYKEIDGEELDPDEYLAKYDDWHDACRKVLIFMLVGIANILDVQVIGTGSVLRTAVIFFYLSNEGISLLENAGHLGLPIPEKLKKVLEQLHDRSEADKKDGE